MSITVINRQGMVSNFRCLSLGELSQRAAMLERLDHKYIVDVDVLRHVLRGMSSSFSALEIGGVRTFGYRTLYFDSSDRRTYHDHHQGRRRRAKVRLRHYVDAKSTFAEVKLKDRRGMTVKSRLKLGAEEIDSLPEDALNFVQDAYHALYMRDFPHELLPVLHIEYQRTTLVADVGGERMTIDSSLRFADGVSSVCLSPRQFILETKSSNGNGLADKILRSLHQHPVDHCSKYCVGTALLNASIKNNRFRPVLRKLERSE